MRTYETRAGRRLGLAALLAMCAGIGSTLFVAAMELGGVVVPWVGWAAVVPGLVAAGAAVLGSAVERKAR